MYFYTSPAVRIGWFLHLYSGLPLLAVLVMSSLEVGRTQSLRNSFAVAGVVHLVAPLSKLMLLSNEQRLSNFVGKAFVPGTGIEPVFAP